jgi:small neutral amino acid transporter SnatA (MarC family)
MRYLFFIAVLYAAFIAHDMISETGHHVFARLVAVLLFALAITPLIKKGI